MKRGQALTEFALVLVIMIGIILGMIDIGPFVFDVYTAKQMSARAARAASIYLPDGYRTCLNDATLAAGEPPLFRATWNLTISSECTSNPLNTIPRGTNLTAYVEVNYEPMFWGEGPWSVTYFTVDQAR